MEIRCEPTYEELKLLLGGKIFFYGRGCEPTYEELKHFPAMTFISDATELRAYLRGIETRGGFWKALQFWLCCEPTYEELKHIKGIGG